LAYCSRMLQIYNSGLAIAGDLSKSHTSLDKFPEDQFINAYLPIFICQPLIIVTNATLKFFIIKPFHTKFTTIFQCFRFHIHKENYIRLWQSTISIHAPIEIQTL
ncbi:hypothetical protein T09_13698, partial [Trichinella sp. T9]